MTERDACTSGRWRAAPSLTIWVYDSPLGATAGEVRFQELARRGAVVVAEAAVVTWVRGSHRPHVRVLRRRASPPEMSVLGELVRLLARPGVEPADPVSALAERIAGAGIDQQLLVEVRRALAPGTSALLVLASDVDLGVVRPIVEHGRARRGVAMMHADLTPTALDVLRQALLPHP